ncbi:bifunctional tRNA (5-methylaminomethyl-2-thiouridine)(34)-methyltransferase MnmD/FAD-dependent 5-carboxymethylaminomethyl-2-thiouridine(34) oxidoreductase MnmC [Providencia burhodogranariea]|uniref:tRNA 5-methylaminomethyl-2-thiouridine biosynthesis bifunctional protein MnmC n=1 Tax=Providencia burhodogranariea DSM 19968 TaxID=1141662 RepID=K8X5W4_9GAMM|nr:bifunctional tRNA (5-methylaminomethyl-2-thiouridine)(34)-methyltransferase MnmD/FAD-dependent 5-carboxymethylaminomethyl-2-thiouridine(34) oxidoreductase MnmC [Providencia burhodogranariea]EKT63835.1 bifunctional tRNA (mnm(5)s(2)U34)-methyltransferase/FAD-dependent cmnm(5)s(2)U34 oxidoreductase [Providencia burhodogranariea DSM 19968]
MKKSVVQTARLSWNDEGTPISEEFGDIYFSNQDGLEETRYVFLQGNQFPERFESHPFETCVIAETGFGTGLNFLTLCQCFEQFRLNHPQAKLQRLHFISFEKYPLSQDDLKAAHSHWPELASLSTLLCERWPQPLPGNQRIVLKNGAIILDLWFGDVNEQLPQLNCNLNNKIDAWFLDGFAPSKNPQMWSEQLFASMAKFARKGGTFATFTAAGFVKRGLREAGFTIKKIKGFGCKREMLTGTLADKDVEKMTPWFSRQPAVTPTDIAIIGGGLASLTTAYSLVQRGALVTIYCKDQHVAQNASGNRQGAVYPLINGRDDALERFFISAFPYAHRFYHELVDLGIQFDGQWCGVSELAYHERSRRKIDSMLQTQWPEIFAAEKSCEQLSELAGLNINHSGIHYTNGGWLCPAQLCESLMYFLSNKGVKFCFEHDITEIKHSIDGWQLSADITGIEKQFLHQTVVIANGHLLSQFAQTQMLPVTPVKGQVSHIPTNSSLSQLKNVLCYEGYLTPVNPTNQQHCIGASYQRNQLDFNYSETDQQENRQKLINSLPDVNWPNEVDVSDKHSRQGIRAVIRDHMPLVGNVPDFARLMESYQDLPEQIQKQADIELAPIHPNLFVLGALGSRGLSTAPLCGELLAAQIFAEPLPLDDETLAGLHPNRFWVRKLLKGREVKTEKHK